MSITQRIVVPVVVAFGLCIVGSACSSSSSKSASPSTTTASATTVEGAPTTTLPDDGSKFCATVKRLNKSGSLDPANSGRTGGPARLQEAFTELEAVAPDSLKDPIRTVATALQTIADDHPTNDDELRTLNRKITDQDVAGASETLETYVSEHCKVPLGG